MHIMHTQAEINGFLPCLEEPLPRVGYAFAVVSWLEAERPCESVQDGTWGVGFQRANDLQQEAALGCLSRIEVCRLQTHLQDFPRSSKTVRQLSGLEVLGPLSLSVILRSLVRFSSAVTRRFPFAVEARAPLDSGA